MATPVVNPTAVIVDGAAQRRIKMQPYVKMWYAYLEQGKIMGVKCKRCGSYEFPALSICNACSCTDVEWVEMSGKGTLISLNQIFYADIPFAKYAPFLYGNVSLEEGPKFPGIVFGVDVKDAVKLFDKLPVEVRAEIMDREGYKAVAYRVVNKL